MTSPIESSYDFKKKEAVIYSLWQNANYFQAAFNKDGIVRNLKRSKSKPFVIIMPPPNVTGRLHMGHALNNTIQDILIRYKRMEGFDALWVPGTDHAGISTQSVVKKNLDAQGIDYRNLSREDFQKKVWKWKEKYGDFILNQLKRLGCSCDWSRSVFTMDDTPSKAVSYAFCDLYKKGLIYKGKRIVNWCPLDQTALSDDEVEVEVEEGSLWYIRYFFSNRKDSVVIATTRPETLFGDVAVAVHPDDKRYRRLKNQKIIVPIVEKEVSVVFDSFVEMNFGSGCVKITPAHDANDFEVGKRHQLDCINVMDQEACMNERVPKDFRGLSREVCRQKVLQILSEKGLLVKEEKKKIAIGRSYRSKAIIEYRLSDQWFVKMKELAQEVLNHDEAFHVFPIHWKKVYHHWLNHIQDWCISRQIWWGHRIPAWIHKQTKQIIVGQNIPKQVLENSNEWEQENDVLDTWFSSSLWPMSSLGWPENTFDFKRYFPTTILSTAKDILFFWVARMNMMTFHFQKKIPYQDVYFHSTVMDKNGKTMSKSKGNGIDPIHIIEGATKEELKDPIYDAKPSNMKSMLKAIEQNYPEGFFGVGCDALRYTLIYLCSSGQELHLSIDRFVDIGRRFITKFWNAARFVLTHLNDLEDATYVKKKFIPREEDLWILMRFSQTLTEVKKALDLYEFSKLGSLYYKFVWNDFCDWYLELTKLFFKTSDNLVKKREKIFFLTLVLKKTLKILHPLLPFVTEELWSSLRSLSIKKGFWAQEDEQQHLIVATFPKEKKNTFLKENQQRSHSFQFLQSIVTSIRSLRKRFHIKESEIINCFYKIIDPKEKNIFIYHKASICNFAKLSIKEVNHTNHLDLLTKIVFPALEIFLDLRHLVDFDKEKQRLKTVIEKTEKEFSQCQKKLNNENFLKKAKKKIVDKEQKKKKTLEATLKRIKVELQSFS